MLAISLHQPYASCIALGHKQVETRSWPTHHRGLIAIHAAKAWGRQQRENYEMASAGLDLQLPDSLPLGSVVAVANLTDCFKMGSDEERWVELAPHFSVEDALGDWENDRYAWVLEDVRALRKPFRIGGHQRLWVLSVGDSAKVLELCGLSEATA